MTELETTKLYLSTATNRGSHSIAVHNQLLLAASNSVVFYDYINHKYVNKIDCHKASITSVKWIVPELSFITGCSDGSVKIWSRKSLDQEFIVEHEFHEHKKSILFAISFWDEVNNEYITMTSGSDQVVRIWINSTCVTEQVFNFYVFDGRIIHYQTKSNDNVNLFVLAGSDSKVHLQQLTKQNKIRKICRLEGHQEWIRSVDITFISEDTILVASGCQDNFIRIWKINLETSFKDNINATDFISLETVIVGHEDKIYCVKWVNCISKDNDRLKLLSTSIDKSAIVWEQPDNVKSKVWTEKYRFGEISGNNLGFLSGDISPDGRYLIINSYNGALHAWHQKEPNQWLRHPIVGGHLGEINDLSWSVDGNYLFSAGTDCSTRIHGEWKKTGTWHEIARPQVHGYEINCITPISSVLFASGADEKVIRIYKSTKYFLQCLANVTKNEIDLNEKTKSQLADFATIPLLGLSNKAIFVSNGDPNVSQVHPSTYDCPPTEETLLQHTCWSEIAKLYGHGYEMFSLTSSHNQRFLASACKSTTTIDASICLWDIENNFNLVVRLPFHRLTVTRLLFSPDDSMLLSVSRDRSWQLFGIRIDEQGQVDAWSKSEQPLSMRTLHSRLIRDACWFADSTHFVTVSRDQTAICWNTGLTSDRLCTVTPVPFRFKADHAINCCDISNHLCAPEDHLIALGLENGDLLLTVLNVNTGWTLLKHFKQLHSLGIKRVAFNPLHPNLLATAGIDGYVQILKFT